MTRRQILRRDLRIQILALVKAWKTDCRIHGKREFRRNECFLFFFCHPLPAIPLFDRSARFQTVSQTRVLFAKRDWSTCLRIGKSFYGIFPGRKSTARWTTAHRWWLNSHSYFSIVFHAVLCSRERDENVYIERQRIINNRKNYSCFWCDYRKSTQKEYKKSKIN